MLPKLSHRANSFESRRVVISLLVGVGNSLSQIVGAYLKLLIIARNTIIQLARDCSLYNSPLTNPDFLISKNLERSIWCRREWTRQSVLFQKLQMAELRNSITSVIKSYFCGFFFDRQVGSVPSWCVHLITHA